MKGLLCSAYGRCSYLTVAECTGARGKTLRLVALLSSAMHLDRRRRSCHRPHMYPTVCSLGLFGTGECTRSSKRAFHQSRTRRRAAIFAGRRVFRTLRPPVRRVGLVGLVLCSWRPRLGDRDRITRLPRFTQDGLRLNPTAASSSCCLSFTTTLHPLVGRHHHARVNRPLSPPADN